MQPLTIISTRSLRYSFANAVAARTPVSPVSRSHPSVGQKKKHDQESPTCPLCLCQTVCATVRIDSGSKQIPRLSLQVCKAIPIELPSWPSKQLNLHAPQEKKKQREQITTHCVTGIPCCHCLPCNWTYACCGPLSTASVQCPLAATTWQ